MGNEYGTCEDKKVGGDAEAAAREGGHAAAVQGPGVWRLPIPASC